MICAGWSRITAGEQRMLKLWILLEFNHCLEARKLKQQGDIIHAFLQVELDMIEKVTRLNKIQ